MIRSPAERERVSALIARMRAAMLRGDDPASADVARLARVWRFPCTRTHWRNAEIARKSAPAPHRPASNEAIGSRSPSAYANRAFALDR